MLPSFLSLVVLLLCITYSLAADFYDVLGGEPSIRARPHKLTKPTVSRTASDAEIRKAYKKLSKKYHPDKNQEEGAEEKFVEIAYGTPTLH